MGYRSEVFLGISFKTPEQMDEVLAVYALDPLVQKNEALEYWNIDRDWARMWYYDDYVTWYPELGDVHEAIHHIEKVAEDFAKNRGFQYRSYFFRIGEEPTDLEERAEGNTLAPGLFAFEDVIYLERRLLVDL